MIIYTIAFLWGFSEATFFFFVPDIFLTWVALHKLRRALYACLWTLFGALLGGALVFYFARENPELSYKILERIPAISPEMIEKVRANRDQSSFFSMLFGALKGIPYKIFAVSAGEGGGRPFLFLLASIPARLFRFVLTTLLAGMVSIFLLKHFSLKQKRAIHLVLWFAFYTFYFSVLGV